jgi:hypothetical protein
MVFPYVRPVSAIMSAQKAFGEMTSRGNKVFITGRFRDLPLRVSIGWPPKIEFLYASNAS